MEWYPLRLTSSVTTHVFGGRAIVDRLGRAGLPDGRIAESWEVSAAGDDSARVTNGPLAGTPLRQLALDHPEDVVAPGWHGPRFPLMAKFIDAHGALPVRVHPDDEAARRWYDEPNGKTEAWHVLAAAPGATALVGARVEASGRGTELRDGLLAQEFDSVLRRLPLRAGETVYVPGGTPHSFGPGALVYEIGQTSTLMEHAMHWEQEDGAAIDNDTWRANVDRMVRVCQPKHRPESVPGLRVSVNDGVDRVMLAAGPHFAMERWRVSTMLPMAHDFHSALVISNVGGPTTVVSGGYRVPLGAAETVLLPAALGQLEMLGPADVIASYLPDLDRDVRTPLRAAGYGDAAIATLGEGLDGPLTDASTPERV